METKTFSSKISEYWEVRKGIIAAATANDDEKLRFYAKQHPSIFENVLKYVKNQSKGPRK